MLGELSLGHIKFGGSLTMSASFQKLHTSTLFGPTLFGPRELKLGWGKYLTKTLITPPFFFFFFAAVAEANIAVAKL